MAFLNRHAKTPSVLFGIAGVDAAAMTTVLFTRKLSLFVDDNPSKLNLNAVPLINTKLFTTKYLYTDLPDQTTVKSELAGIVKERTNVPS